MQSDLYHSDQPDATGTSSACKMRSTESEHHVTNLLATKPQEDRERKAVSFVEAVHWKYQPSNIQVESADNIVILHTSGNIQTTSSGGISLPRQVSMSGQRITIAGDAASIEKMCARVTELDLMENTITSWKQVFNIIECIPHLTFLNLTSNQLVSHVSSLICSRSRPLPCLTHLVLNNTGVTWDIINQLLVIFPRLIELHLGRNNYQNVQLNCPSQSGVSSLQSQTDKNQPTAGESESTLDNLSASAKLRLLSDNSSAASASGLSKKEETTDNANLYPAPPSGPSALAPSATTLRPSPICSLAVHRLFFANNCITEWEEISKLGRSFPNLEYLLLSETDITGLGNPQDIPQCFPNLKSLGLGQTQLKSWEEVEKLVCFPMLTDVRLSGIPFLDAIPKHIRFQHTVALLPNIRMLNGSKVTESEREDAERAFLRKYMDADTKPSRYYQLEEKYGRLDPLAQVELTPQATVKMKVRVEDAQQRVVKQEEMDIELDQTVRALRKLLSVMAGKPAGKIALFYMDNQLHYNWSVSKKQQQFTLTFPSPSTCKMGTQLQAILEFVICAYNTLQTGYFKEVFQMHWSAEALVALLCGDTVRLCYEAKFPKRD
ncbi:tubulin-specific chaperone cofactor E-like protein [Elysia marginata]|uniref:Tubulin-specific chaperone cofactor E-like protein n=1 Tax=Elysia marginata TaxID=1093978 RepID=A0AAV4GSQ5_9GAST|nr:tubulin-specific chaperone cofactor E-like protein [Elysia marginata]